MGQKVNPHGLRVGVIKEWDSKWYADKSNFGDNLVEDFKIRKVLKKKLFPAGVARIEIERAATKIRISIHAAKPGIIIGRQGSEIDKLKVMLQGMVNKDVNINIVEIKQPDLNAQLVAENIAAQLEKRISFRMAMKQAMSGTMRLNAKGIKTCVVRPSGRRGNRPYRALS